MNETIFWYKGCCLFGFQLFWDTVCKYVIKDKTGIIIALIQQEEIYHLSWMHEYDRRYQYLNLLDPIVDKKLILYLAQKYRIELKKKTPTRLLKRLKEIILF